MAASPCRLGVAESNGVLAADRTQVLQFWASRAPATRRQRVAISVTV